MNMNIFILNYQPNEYSEKLHHIGVSDRIETAENSVDHSDRRRYNDGDAEVQIQNDSDSSS